MSTPDNAQLCSKRNIIKIKIGMQTYVYLGLYNLSKSTPWWRLEKTTEQPTHKKRNMF